MPTRVCARSSSVGLWPPLATAERARAMPFVRYVLGKPYTVAAVLLLISLLAVGEALRMPVDIFPKMDIPVVSVVWTYAGLSAPDMQNRVLTLHERQLASLV